MTVEYFVVSAPLPNSHPFLSHSLSIFLSFVAMLLLHTHANCPMHNSCVCVSIWKNARVLTNSWLTQRHTYAKWQTRMVTHMNAYAIYHRHRILTEKINTLCHHCCFFLFCSHGICISETIKSTVCWHLLTHSNFHGHLNTHPHTHTRSTHQMFVLVI